MRAKERVYRLLEATIVGRALLADSRLRAVLFACLSMSWNFIFGLFNGVLAIAHGSFWYLTLCAYYLMLGGMRLSVIAADLKFSRSAGKRAMRADGIALIALAALIAGMVSLSFIHPQGNRHDLVTMIAIATFTFALAVHAIRNSLRARKERSWAVHALRDISLAGAVVSMLSLERSMIATFGDSAEYWARVMEGITGMVVFAFVTAIGGVMIARSRTISPRQR